MAQGFWGRHDKAQRRREHNRETCSECNPRGLATDAVMERLARHQADIYGPPPAEDWSTYGERVGTE